MIGHYNKCNIFDLRYFRTVKLTKEHCKNTHRLFAEVVQNDLQTGTLKK